MREADIVAPVSLERAAAIVAYIREAARDDEFAHILEDKLRAAVLETIANGAVLDPEDTSRADLARIALSTADIDFARWCS